MFDWWEWFEDNELRRDEVAEERRRAADGLEKRAAMRGGGLKLEVTSSEIVMFSDSSGMSSLMSAAGAADGCSCIGEAYVWKIYLHEICA